MTTEELNKIVHVTDMDNYWSLGRMPYNSPENKRAAQYDKFYGIQRMMNKITKSFGWRVHSQKFDRETKSFDVKIMENSKIADTKHFSYEDICKFMWWHSFELAEADTVLPKPFTYEEREAVERPLIEATKLRDAKAARKAKKAEEKQEKEENEASKKKVK